VTACVVLAGAPRMEVRALSAEEEEEEEMMEGAANVCVCDCWTIPIPPPAMPPSLPPPLPPPLPSPSIAGMTGAV